MQEASTSEPDKRAQGLERIVINREQEKQVLVFDLIKPNKPEHDALHSN